MGISAWVTGNWFDLLQSLGIIGGLLFTAHSLRSEAKTRRVNNLLAITDGHRKVWTEFYRPELKRVLSEQADPSRDEITHEEEVFVNFVILHLNGVICALKSGLVFEIDGLRRDVGRFFSLPIPRAVWTKTRLLQNDGFVMFVEACLAENSQRNAE